MNKDFLIFIVEDDKTMRLLLEDELGERYRVETFASGEACLERLTSAQPNLFLIDVGLPGINGYDLCKNFRQQAALAHTPVLFISNYDRLEDMVAGYDAGGDDYIVKPFNVAILARKVESLLRVEHTQQTAIDQARSADELASMALANLDEYAVLIRFLRSLNDCDHPRTLTRLLFELLGKYALDGTIQIRLHGLEWTVSPEGDNRPLEVAIMQHVRDMDRIFEFKMRAAFNFESITILVNNMPTQDPELCGRIRDDVLIAAECANAKLQAILAAAENTRAKSTATALLDTLREAVKGFEHAYATARYRGTVLTQEMLDELAEACASLGLSDEQEDRIQSMIRHKVALLSETYDFSTETQSALNDQATRLADILQPSSAPMGAWLMADQEPSAVAVNASVELF